MGRYYIMGMLIIGLMGCASNSTKNDNILKVKNRDINGTESIKVVNLDILTRDFKKGSLFGGDRTKKISISIFGYSEIVFKGELLKKADKIKIDTNDEVDLNSSMSFKLKTSELKDGDTIYIFDKDNNTIAEIKIRGY